MADEKELSEAAWMPALVNTKLQIRQLVARAESPDEAWQILVFISQEIIAHTNKLKPSMARKLISELDLTRAIAAEPTDEYDPDDEQDEDEDDEEPLPRLQSIVHEDEQVNSD